MAKIRVALIYGGASGEHSVSCLTASSVMKAIDQSKYEIIPVGIRRDGQWVPGESDPAVLDAAAPCGEVGPSDTQISVAMGGCRELIYSGAEQRTEKIDVAFPLLHGSFGEDGTIQGLLEMAGIPYVGSGVFASAAGMDKHFMKVVLEAAHIPVAPYVLATASRWARERDAVLSEVRERLKFPVFVKPARAGSSLGISRVDRIEDLPKAVDSAAKVDPKVLIEQGVEGTEVECAVLGGRDGERARASVLGEIALDLPGGGWYDYSTKYVATEGFHMVIPAVVPKEDTQRIREMAVDVFEAFDCEGMTRVDFFYTPSGDIIVNEHNTIPGFTEFSMYPVLWDHSGLPYTQLLDELLTLALTRPLGLR